MSTQVRSQRVEAVDSTHALRAEQAVAKSALGVISGVLLSGPIALLLVETIHPQPAWQGPARFASEFHAIQLLPYLGGFVLIGSCVALVASLHALVPVGRESRANVALALAAAFAALILLNYVLQTSFVPSMVRPYDRGHDALITAFTMSNPRSLAWALEMWGYAVFGIATWVVSCAFDSSRLERITSASYLANGAISIVGAIATMMSPSWLLSTGGIVAFVLWNALMLVMATLTLAAMRQRRRDHGSAPPLNDGFVQGLHDRR